MGKRFVQKEEPVHADLTPGDEWLAPKGEDFFHKVWTGETMGWSTGALSAHPDDLGSEKRAAEADLKEQEKGSSEKSGEGETEEEESDDDDSSEVSDSDGDDEGSGGKSGSKPQQGGKRKGLFQGRKGSR